MKMNSITLKGISNLLKKMIACLLILLLSLSIAEPLVGASIAFMGEENIYYDIYTGGADSLNEKNDESAVDQRDVYSITNPDTGPDKYSFGAVETDGALFGLNSETMPYGKFENDDLAIITEQNDAEYTVTEQKHPDNAINSAMVIEIDAIADEIEKSIADELKFSEGVTESEYDIEIPDLTDKTEEVNQKDTKIKEYLDENIFDDKPDDISDDTIKEEKEQEDNNLIESVSEKVDIEETETIEEIDEDNNTEIIITENEPEDKTILITKINQFPYIDQDNPDNNYITVDTGTPVEDIPFPMELKAWAVLDYPWSEEYTIKVAEWYCSGGYNPWREALYQFMPVLNLNDDEILAPETGLPVIYVEVINPVGFFTTAGFTAYGTDISVYVDENSGSDSYGDGTRGNPYASIQGAITENNEIDEITIYLLSDIFCHDSGGSGGTLSISGKSVTIRSALIDGYDETPENIYSIKRDDGTNGGGHPFTGVMILIEGGANLYLKDVIIDGNQVPGARSAVWVNDGYFETLNTEIINNLSIENGGAVYISPGSEYRMADGRISGCISAENGGAVYIDSGILTLCGSPKIGVDYNDNGIYIRSGYVMIDDSFGTGDDGSAWILYEGIAGRREGAPVAFRMTGAASPAEAEQLIWKYPSYTVKESGSSYVLEINHEVEFYIAASDAVPAGSDIYGNGTRLYPFESLNKAMLETPVRYDGTAYPVIINLMTDVVQDHMLMLMPGYDITIKKDPLVTGDVTLYRYKDQEDDTYSYRGYMISVAGGARLTIGSELTDAGGDIILSGNGIKNASSLVYMYGGEVLIYSGLLTGNHSTGYGGAIYMNNSPTNRITIIGGAIKGNGSSTNGGDIFFANGRFEVSGNPYIGSPLYGGGVFINNGLTITVTEPLDPTSLIYIEAVVTDGDEGRDPIKGTIVALPGPYHTLSPEEARRFIWLGPRKKIVFDSGRYIIDLSNDYYVASYGSDDDAYADGTIMRPYFSIHKAVTSVTPVTGGIRQEYSVKVIDNIIINESVTIPNGNDTVIKTWEDARSTATVTRTAGGDLFIIEDDATLCFENIIINGAKDKVVNTSPIVTINGITAGLTLGAGAVLKNNRSVNGGAVNMSSGSFHMNGGEIKDNAATGRGGGIYNNGGAIDISGGTITGNTSTDSGRGIYYGAGTVTVSGRLQIGKDKASNNNTTDNGIYIANTDLVIRQNGNLIGDAHIEIELKASATANDYYNIVDKTAGANTSEALRYKYQNVKYYIRPSEDECYYRLGLTAGSNIYVSVNGSDYYSDSNNGSDYNLGTYEYPFRTLEKAFDEAENNTLTNVYLMTDMIHSDTDLSGSDLIGLNLGTAVVNNGKRINLTNYISGEITSQPIEKDNKYVTRNLESAMIRVEGTGELNISGLTFDGNMNRTGSSLTDDSIISVNGGNLRIDNTILMNNCSEKGGAVYLSSGSFTMGSGEIKDNIAQTDGGGVFIGNGSFSMSGGLITGNKAEEGKGSAVYYGEGSITVSDSARIGKLKAENAGFPDNGIFIEKAENFITQQGNLSETAHIEIELYVNNTSNHDGAIVVNKAGGTTQDDSVRYYYQDALYSVGPNSDLSLNPRYHLFGRTEYYVSDNEDIERGPVGEDSNPGTYEYPFKTLSRAFEAAAKDRRQTDVYIMTDLLHTGAITTNEGNNVHLFPYEGYKPKGAVPQGQEDGVADVPTIKRTDITAMFTIPTNDSLTIENLIVDGDRFNAELINSSPIALVSGSFTVNPGAILMNNNNANGGAVSVSGGSLSMNGGIITGNYATVNGGAVNMTGTGSSFTINGGEISGNSAAASGGAVNITNGSFLMNNGEITGNEATGLATDNGGGAINISSTTGTFIMRGGEIRENRANGVGGAINIYYGAFSMSAGLITGNTALRNGGGIYISPTPVSNNGTITINGGSIISNTAVNGGAVYFSRGVMSISGNPQIGEIGGSGIYLAQIPSSSNVAEISQIADLDITAFIEIEYTAREGYNALIATKAGGVNTQNDTGKYHYQNELYTVAQISQGSNLYVLNIGNDLYVSRNGNDSWIGTADQPFRTLGHAFSVAPSGRTEGVNVHVMTDLLLTETAMVTSGKTINLHAYTGYQQGEKGIEDRPTITRGQTGVMIAINRTDELAALSANLNITGLIIDGNRDLYPTNDASIITLSGSLTAAAKLELNDVILRNNHSYNGGAISISGRNSTLMPVLIADGSRITGNTVSGDGVSSGFGGGIYAGTPYGESNSYGVFGMTLNNCQITDNTAVNGGGIAAKNATTTTVSIIVTGGEISRNIASGNGGGINVNLRTQTTITNCAFVDNKATNGGAFFITGSGTSNSQMDFQRAQVTMDNGVIRGNSASNAGGGVYLNNYAHLFLNDSNILENIASSGGGIYMLSNAYAKYLDIIGGQIIDNTLASPTALGRGVYFGAGTMTVSGDAVIGRNNSENGVYIASAAGVLTQSGDLAPGAHIEVEYKTSAESNPVIVEKRDPSNTSIGYIGVNDAAKYNYQDDKYSIIERIVSGAAQYVLNDSGNLYVSKDGSDANIGTDPDHPFATLGRAFNEAMPGYKTNVHVMTDLIHGNAASVQGGRIINLLPYEGYSRLGGDGLGDAPTVTRAPGYAGVMIAVREDIQEQDNNQIGGSLRISGLVFDGNQDSSGTGSILSATARNTISNNSRGAVLELDNVTLRNNFATHGGAITLAGGSAAVGGNPVHRASLTINDSLISGNKADNGGAIYTADSFVRIDMDGCLITDNQADSGGGIYANNAEGAISLNNTKITDDSGAIEKTPNRAINGNGGGIYLSGSDESDMLSLTLADSEITGNTATGNGGGVYFGGGSLTLAGEVVIAEDTSGTAAEDGFGVFIAGADAGLAIAQEDNLTGGSFVEVELKTSAGAGAGDGALIVNKNGGAPVDAVEAARYHYQYEAYKIAAADNGVQYILNVKEEELYVSGNEVIVNGPAGSDIAGTGSRDKPFRTLSKAFSVAAAGERVTYVNIMTADLLHSTGAGTATATISGGKNIHLRPDPLASPALSEVVVSRGHTAEMIAVAEGGKLTIEGVTFDGQLDTAITSAVIINGGELTLKGAVIRNNRSTNGGAIVNTGQATMEDGSISLNKAANGGGVYMTSGSFTMKGGEIRGNETLTGDGGGVYLGGGGSFGMTGGRIEGNKAAGKGGAIYYSGGTLSVSGDVMIGNEKETTGGAEVYGNGVFIESGGGLCITQADDLGAAHIEIELKNGAANGSLIAAKYDGAPVGAVEAAKYHYKYEVYAVVPNIGEMQYVLDMSSTQLYVSGNDIPAAGPIGSDETGFGTRERPFRTLSKAFEIAPAGDGISGDMTYINIMTASLIHSTGAATATAAVGSGKNLYLLPDPLSIPALTNVTVRRSEPAAMVTVAEGGRLTVENITFDGQLGAASTASAILNGGELTLKNTSVQNNRSAGNGGAVANTGTITMNGGAVSGNTAVSGGGIYQSTGAFTLESGLIANNRSTGAATMNGGGGVYLSGGTFTMAGGTIRDNEAAGAAALNGGGGVYISGGSFEMTGGGITGNRLTTPGTQTVPLARGRGLYFGGGALTVSGDVRIGDKKTIVSGVEINDNGVYIAAGLAITQKNDLGPVGNIEIERIAAPDYGALIANKDGGAMTDTAEAAKYHYQDEVYKVVPKAGEMKYILYVSDGLYVSGNDAAGNDITGLGTPERPFRTLKRAFEAAGTDRVTDVYIMTAELIHTTAANPGAAVVGAGKNIRLQPAPGAVFPAGPDGSPGLSVRRSADAEMIRVATGGSLAVTNITFDGQKDIYSANITSVIVNSGTLSLDRVHIRNNRSSAGGGITNNGSVTMNDSVIAGNIATGTVASRGGGGVYQTSGSFTLKSGWITDNRSAGTLASNGGGGVYIIGGDFEMTGGEISLNEAAGASASNGGGGIYLGPGASFTMTGGCVTENRLINTGTPATPLARGRGVWFGGLGMDISGEVCIGAYSGDNGVYIAEPALTITQSDELIGAANIEVERKNGQRYGMEIVDKTAGAVTGAEASRYHYQYEVYNIVDGNIGNYYILDISDELYVSGNENPFNGAVGDDETGLGTPEKPFRTLSKAFEEAAAGIPAYVYIMTAELLHSAGGRTSPAIVGSGKDIYLKPDWPDYPKQKPHVSDLAAGEEVTVKRSSAAEMVTIAAGGTLTIENITFDGSKDIYPANLSAVIGNAGTLTLNKTVIRDNRSSMGGGMTNTGITTMNDSLISGNIAAGTGPARGGGGVYQSGGSFTMNSGGITGNRSAGAAASNGGGGVYLTGGDFEMTSGEIRGNDASGTADTNGGGGVYLSGGAFRMSGGEIEGNTADAQYGQGIYFAGGALDISGNVTIGRDRGANGRYNGVYIAANSLAITQSAALGDALIEVELKKGPGSAAADDGALIVNKTGAVSESEAGKYHYQYEVYSIVPHGTNDQYILEGSKELFVSMGGSDDTGDGTREEPFRTLSKAFAEALNNRPTYVYIMSADLSHSSGAGTETATTTTLKNIYLRPEYLHPEAESLVPPALLFGTEVAVTRNAAAVMIATAGKLTVDSITFDGQKGIYTANTTSVISNTGTLALDNVTIRDNRSAYGGGIANTGAVTMNGGSVRDNIAADDGSARGGGGIYQTGASSEFIMTGSLIIGNVSGNIISGTAASHGGGGVYLAGGQFTMRSGAISGNTAANSGTSPVNGDGGGLSVTGGTFTMSGGAVSSNKAAVNGGGVYLRGAGVFETGGGVITGNILASPAAVGVGVCYAGGELRVYDQPSIGLDGEDGGVYIAGIAPGSTPVIRQTGALTGGAGINIEGINGAAAGTPVALKTDGWTTADEALYYHYLPGVYEVAKRPDSTEIYYLGYHVSYYVSERYGKDELPGNGTKESPFKTLQKAVDVAPDDSLEPMTTVYVMDDMIQNSVTTVKGDKNITIQAWRNDSAVLESPPMGEPALITAKPDNQQVIVGRGPDYTDGFILEVLSGNSLTLQDLTIDGNNVATESNAATLATDGGGFAAVRVYADGAGDAVLNVETGGYIVNNDNAGQYGGGVYVHAAAAAGEGSAVLNMNGGGITGNTAASDPGTDEGGGGGVYLRGAGPTRQALMSISGSAAVAHNEATAGTDTGGGAVYIAEYGRLNIADGILNGNTAVRGGGIYQANASGNLLAMSGGLISGNEAVAAGAAGGLGGGMYLAREAGTGPDPDATALYGGLITGNRAEAAGGAAWVADNARPSVGKLTRIGANQKDNGVYLAGPDAFFSQRYDLDEKARINIEGKAGASADPVTEIARKVSADAKPDESRLYWYQDRWYTVAPHPDQSTPVHRRTYVLKYTDEFFVASHEGAYEGNDATGDGSREYPYATLERAMEDMRNFKLDTPVTTDIQTTLYILDDLALGGAPAGPANQAAQSKPVEIGEGEDVLIVTWRDTGNRGGDGKATLKRSAGYTGGLFTVKPGGSLTLADVIVSGAFDETGATAAGSIVTVEGAGQLNAEESNKAVFRLAEGGELRHNAVTGDGGAIHMSGTTARVYIEGGDMEGDGNYGGMITGNDADGKGKAVYYAAGLLTVKGRPAIGRDALDNGVYIAAANLFISQTDDLLAGSNINIEGMEGAHAGYPVVHKNLELQPVLAVTLSESLYYHWMNLYSGANGQGGLLYRVIPGGFNEYELALVKAFYVRTTGDDEANPGTQLEPFETIERAFAFAMMVPEEYVTIIVMNDVEIGSYNAAAPVAGPFRFAGISLFAAEEIVFSPFDEAITYEAPAKVGPGKTIELRGDPLAGGAVTVKRADGYTGPMIEVTAETEGGYYDPGKFILTDVILSCEEAGGNECDTAIILNPGAEMILNSGEITRNKAEAGAPAAIYIGNEAGLTILNGRINTNTSDTAAILADNGSFIMKAGLISNNAVGTGAGAVTLRGAEAALTMSGGEISHNQGVGYAVLYPEGRLTVSGGARIVSGRLLHGLYIGGDPDLVIHVEGDFKGLIEIAGKAGVIPDGSAEGTVIAVKTGASVTPEESRRFFWEPKYYSVIDHPAAAYPLLDDNVYILGTFGVMFVDARADGVEDTFTTTKIMLLFDDDVPELSGADKTKYHIDVEFSDGYGGLGDIIVTGGLKRVGYGLYELEIVDNKAWKQDDKVDVSVRVDGVGVKPETIYGVKLHRALNDPTGMNAIKETFDPDANMGSGGFSDAVTHINYGEDIQYRIGFTISNELLEALEASPNPSLEIQDILPAVLAPKYADPMAPDLGSCVTVTIGGEDITGDGSLMMKYGGRVISYTFDLNVIDLTDYAGCRAYMELTLHFTGPSALPIANRGRVLVNDALNPTGPDDAVTEPGIEKATPEQSVMYLVTVNNSYAATTGAGRYGVNDAVAIQAGSRSGYEFTGWTVSAGGATLDDANVPATSFVMPVGNVTVTANWLSTGGGDDTVRVVRNWTTAEGLELRAQDTVSVDTADGFYSASGGSISGYRYLGYKASQYPITGGFEAYTAGSPNEALTPGVDLYVTYIYDKTPGGGGDDGDGDGDGGNGPNKPEPGDGDGDADSDGDGDADGDGDGSGGGGGQGGSGGEGANPGGKDKDTPPNPSEPGNILVPTDDNEGYLEYKPSGDFVGEWRWNGEAGEWEFTAAEPTGNLPGTGDPSILLFNILGRLLILILCALGVSTIMRIAGKRKARGKRA